MKTQSILLTISAGLISFGLLLFFVQLLSKKFKTISESENGLKLSYGFHIGGIIFSGCLLLSKLLPLISEGFEVQWMQFNDSFVFDALQFTATMIGLTFIWITVQYFISYFIASIVLGERNDKIEMERDGFSFFLSKAIVNIGLAIISYSIIETFLRMFMPVLDIPLYN